MEKVIDKEITINDITIEDDDDLDGFELSDRDFTVDEMKKNNIPLSELFELRGLRFALEWDNAIRIINSRLNKGKVSVNSKSKVIVRLLTRLYPTFL